MARARCILPTPGRPIEEHVGGLLHEAQGAELLDTASVELGLGVEVEVLEPPRCRQTREAPSSGEAPLLGDRHLHPKQPFEERRVAQLLCIIAIPRVQREIALLWYWQ